MPSCEIETNNLAIWCDFRYFITFTIERILTWLRFLHDSGKVPSRALLLRLRKNNCSQNTALSLCITTNS